MKILKHSIFFEYLIPEDIESKFDYWNEIAIDGRLDTYDEWLQLERYFEEYKVRTLING